MARYLVMAVALVGMSCQADYAVIEGEIGGGGVGVKSDRGYPGRTWEVLLTDPHCDVCTSEDKSYLKAESQIVARIVAALDDASRTVEVAQFTFSRTEIRDALLRAHQRGVVVRIAMNEGQNQSGTLSRGLADEGVPLRFVAGKHNGSYAGLMHAKYLRIDGRILFAGSNNWSSTGTSINEENTLSLTTTDGDPLTKAFGCHFEAVWAGNADASAGCSTDEVYFTPGTGAIALVRDGIRAAQESVDVLMHHLVFDKLIKELAKAQERGVQVRVIVNEADRAEVTGRDWTRLVTAGGLIRFKRGNADLYQLMHHKLAIVDDTVLLNGSGNWSGSAFFNNYEFYLRTAHPGVVSPFVRLFDRLWTWSLAAVALDSGMNAAAQHVQNYPVFFGNLHAHHASVGGDTLLDDGMPTRHDEHGDEEHVHEAVSTAEGIAYAYEYARDRGAMDFMALTPHCVWDSPENAPDMPNMSSERFQEIVRTAETVTQNSDGMFVAIPGMEWNTNSRGNHVTVLGSREIAKVETGRFELLYEDFLPGRWLSGDRPMIGFNHPRTFSHHGTLEGSWDQVFDVSLLEIPKSGQRAQKFNDFGLDDYPPLRDVRAQWIDGTAMPDRAVVRETLANLEQVARPYVRFMEVTVGRGKEIAHEQGQNPSLNLDENGEEVRYTRVHSDWDYYLLNGFRLAPAAPHDNHYANWGTGHSSRTALVASTLSEEALMDAIDRRAMYASEDQNLQMRFYAEGRTPMGGSMRTLADEVTLDLLFSDPDYFGSYDVRIWLGTVGGEEVRDVLHTQVSGDVWQQLSVSLPGAGTHFVYVEVLEVGPNRMAWSAPIWIERL